MTGGEGSALDQAVPTTAHCRLQKPKPREPGDIWECHHLQEENLAAFTSGIPKERLITRQGQTFWLYLLVITQPLRIIFLSFGMHSGQDVFIRVLDRIR